VVRHGYAVPTHHGTPDTTTRNASVEYRLFEQAIATTTTRDPTVRLLYVVVSLLETSMWRRPAEASSPLVVAVQRVRQYDSTGCVDGPRGASGRPRESGHLTTDSPLTTDREQASGGGATLSRRRLTAADSDSSSIRPSVILSSRPSVQPLRHRTQAAETASRGCFVRY